MAAATALDHPFPGCIALAVGAGRGSDAISAVSGAELPVIALFTPERVILSAAEPPEHDLLLGFTAGDPLDAWRARARRPAGRAARRWFREPVLPYDPGNRRLRGSAVSNVNDKIYIHEYIDVIGHNRARYMHHMTANWCPVGKAERNMSCFGVWATVGSTGAWPQVVNLWELDGWSGLVANFEHELVGGGAQDPSLAEWWAAAAELRRGGFDRIVVPEPWSPTIDELTSAGVKGAVYADEHVRVPVAGRGEFLSLARVRRAGPRWSRTAFGASARSGLRCLPTPRRS